MRENAGTCLGMELLFGRLFFTYELLRSDRRSISGEAAAAGERRKNRGQTARWIPKSWGYPHNSNQMFRRPTLYWAMNIASLTSMTPLWLTSVL